MCVCMCHFAQGHMRKMCPNQLFPPEVVANIFKCLTVVRSLPLAFVGLSKKKQANKENQQLVFAYVCSPFSSLSLMYSCIPLRVCLKPSDLQSCSMHHSLSALFVHACVPLDPQDKG